MAARPRDLGRGRDGEGLSTLATALGALLAVVVGRAALAWASEVTAHRSSAEVKSELRTALAERAAELGPDGLAVGGTGHLTVLATTGIDALDGYFARYLPQLVLAVIVPLTVLVAIASQDWLSAVIIGVTVPLIPVFMVLIGLATRATTRRQPGALQTLASRFLDIVAGLTTLKVFGRAKAQVRTIRNVADAYRTTTMRTLRVAFLSSLVLELVASVAVALVAVSVGLRLLHGHIGLQTALFLLVLAPEAYLPLRRVGSSFHASAPGLSAADEVLTLLERPADPHGVATFVPNPAHHDVTVTDLTVTYPGRSQPALSDVSLTVRRGEILALTGPSGCGRSTLLSVLLGFLRPASGTVAWATIDPAGTDPEAWRRQLAWGAATPAPLRRVDRRNIRMGRPGATDDDVAAAIDAAGLSPSSPACRPAATPARRARIRAVGRRAPAGGHRPRPAPRRPVRPPRRADGRPRR